MGVRGAEQATAGLTLRAAAADDLDRIAAVFSLSLRTLTFLPALHTPAEERGFLREAILPICDVTVATISATGAIVGFSAVEPLDDQPGFEVRLLYVHPAHFGIGAGSRLIAHAKDRGQPLELWCFLANGRARRFYERCGFRALAFTNGARNEERAPDVRYRWTPATA